MANYNFTVRTDISGTSTSIVDMAWWNDSLTPNNLFVARSSAPQVTDLYNSPIINDSVNPMFNSCTCIAYDGATVYLAYQVGGAAAWIARINRLTPTVITYLNIFPLSTIVDMVYYAGTLYLTDGLIPYYIQNPNSVPAGQVIPTQIVLNTIIPAVTINTLAIVFDTTPTAFLYFGTNRIYAIALPLVSINPLISGPQTSPVYPIQSIAWEPSSPDTPRVWVAANNQLYELRTEGLVQSTTNLPAGSVIKSIQFDTANRLNIATTVHVYRSNDAFCFNEGTKILYMNKEFVDEYVAIEKLQVGDLVKTFKHGYRKIIKTINGKFRNNSNNWNMCMYKMAKTESNGLLEDLIVTGGHSLLLDSISEVEQAKYDEMGLTEFSKEIIDGKRLVLSCVSEKFTPILDDNIYTYYHLLLENNNDANERFGIYANGVLSETPNENCLK